MLVPVNSDAQERFPTSMVLRPLAASVSLILFAACLANAQSPSTNAAVTKYVKAEMARQHIPGLALLVAKNGKIVHAEGFGLSNVELHVAVKPETIFQSGSVGKQFTATAIMMLVEEGKIGLDDPLTKYFPDAPSALERCNCSRTAEPHRGIWRLPQELQLPQRLDRRRTAQAGREHPPRLPSRNEMGVQQFRLCHARHSDSPRDRTILWRFSAAANFPPARDEFDDASSVRPTSFPIALRDIVS